MEFPMQKYFFLKSSICTLSPIANVVAQVSIFRLRGSDSKNWQCAYFQTISGAILEGIGLEFLCLNKMVF